MKRLICLSLTCLCLALLLGCAFYKASVSQEFGTDNWRKYSIVPNRAINVVRGNEQAWIVAVDGAPQDFLLKVHPPRVKITVPPFASFNKDASQSSSTYDSRYYTVPTDKTFEDVFVWYMDWFDFQPLYPDEEGSE